MEVARLKSELAAEREARESAVGRALTSTDEAAAAVSATQEYLCIKRHTISG